MKKNKNYKKWVGVLLSFFLSGLAQFLSGRKLRGICWHCGLFFLFLIIKLSLIFPIINGVYLELFLLFIYIILWFIMLFDSYKPIKRLSFLKCFVLIIIILAVGIIESIFFDISNFSICNSGSMKPTIISKFCEKKSCHDRVIMNKLIYKFRNPQRGEIVTFKSEGIKINRNKINKTHYTKRIVGLPGEKISMRPPYIYINGGKLESPSIFNKISECKNGYKGYFLCPVKNAVLRNETDEIQLGEDEYFVIGDNSRKSFDSRYFGPIKRESIISRATKIIWPPSRIRNLE